MQFQKLTISITLAIATAASLPPTSHASSRYDVIVQQLGLTPTQTPITQPQTTQPQAIESPATQSPAIQIQPQKSNLTAQAGRNFFNHPPTLIRVETSQLGASIPSIYEFTLTVPHDAGQPLKAVTITQAENAETIIFDEKSPI